MEIVTSLPTDTTGASGGTKKHVEEWSRLDRLTGMLEHARVEADHWASNTSNSRHHYGKVVDSRARNLADGSVQQQQQTKQLEVFQAHIPGGSVQVIRSHTSTSSSWQKSKILQSKSHMDWSADIGDKHSQRTKIIESPIDNLKLHHNLINLETEKTKANVARCLPIRRPPTRGKPLKPSSEDDFFNDLPKICSDAQRETEKRLDAIAKELKSTLVESISLHRAVTNGVADDSNEHQKLEKKKSISDENLSVVDEKENSDPWKRDSKARWSFQYPRSKFKDNKVDLESKSELETVLEKVLKRKGEAIEKQPTVEHLIKTTPPLWKRKSFVTEQTLKETKQKLRHLNIDDCKVEIARTDNEDTDDGICTESKGNSDKEDDKEDLLYVKKSDIVGTGSLELRNKNKSDDWFDRRKSYGFEPVYGQRNIVAMKNTASKTNTSTDSGICRSSELELISTPIVKKLTEANAELCHNINFTDDFQESTSKTVGISELLSKFEKKSETRATATVVTLPQAELPTRQVEAFDGRENIKCGKVAKLIRSLRENTITENAFKPKSTVKIESCFIDETKNVPKDAKNFDTGLLSKRHSIACDDAQYIKFKDVDELHDKPLLNSFDLDHLNTTVINVNNFESGDTTTAIAVDNSALFVGDAADVKKPKKVEFSKTEVHFAAAEPGKIKIVETDEKPPPANLYRRKKRSVSASPKIDVSEPQTKFNYEKSYEEKGDHQIEPATEFAKPEMFNSGQFTSTTSDNGLAVRISSTKPSDFRRASWSVVDTKENKSGYSTKINFGGQGVTVVADAKSQKYDEFKDLNTNYEKSFSNDLDVDNIRNGADFQKKLIVRIGGCGSHIGTADKYVRNRFTSSFRNSLSNKTEVVSSEIDSSTLKSTSLIIDTIKRSTNSRVQIWNTKKDKDVEMENRISDLRHNEKNIEATVEQPSTYITEMNKLQQTHRIKQNRSVDKITLKDEKAKTRIYNTVPVTKNGFLRPKILTNDLPSVLNAFDNLCQSINKAIDENKNAVSSDAKKKSNQNTQHVLTKFETRSSESWLLNQVVNSQNDDNLSDDSLKADEEVRSYMSTAIMEEYENELSGSWSRRKYYKHIKPVNVAAKDEISEKSHFKPLRSEEEKLKTVTSTTNVDIKRPKITSVAVNLPSVTTSITEDSKNITKNCTTVLLNNTIPKSENCSSKLKNDQTVINDLSAKLNSYENTRKNNSSFKITTTVKSIPTTEGNTNSKQDYKSIKVIHHGIRLPEKQKPVEYRHLESLRKETSKKEPSKNKVIKTLSGNSTSANSGSIRKKLAYDKERLFNSGRDSWLNLPKERKTTNEKNIYAECAKIKPTQFRKIQTEDKKRNEKDSNMNKVLSDYLSNGFVDGSSEEDAYRHSYKKHSFTQPLTTISEKSSLKVNKKVDSGSLRLSGSKAPITRTTSNSSLESRSNSYEFKNPVLKTEERSKRRATRMIQRASSREALLNAVSSSEDITSENEIRCLRSSKLKSPRKLKSCKTSKINQSLQETNPNINRMIKQQTAKMEINIFNIKERPNDKTIIYPSSRSHPSKNVITKSRPKQDQQGTELHTSSQKSRISHRSTNNGKTNVYNQSSPPKVVRSNGK